MKILLIILISIVLITGGILMKLGTPFDNFLTKDFTKPTKTEQIDYLKEHKEEMTDFVKNQNSKATSVQWDWESVELQEFQPNAGGIPTGEKYNTMSIDGKFNNIVDSNFQIEWQLAKNSYFPKISWMYVTKDLRVLKEIDGTKGWVNYE